uniref:Uncharacterized protein n=1 Tax=Plectus sambesii TaxID=2011161 RepID=A0A914UNI7_9BILA
MKLAEKSRRKVEKYIEKLQAKLDELECREVDLLADDYDDAKEERRYKLMALLTKKLFRLREQLAKSFPERYEAKVGRDAVEDKLIILGTGSQALNDALTEFVNRPPSLKRRHLSAELGNNYCQHFNLPKPEEVREMVDKLIIVHPDKFSKDPIEIEQLINSAVDTVYKQVKGRRVEDHKMAIEEFEEWAKEHGDQEPSAEALSLVNEARPVTLRPVSFSTFQEVCRSTVHLTVRRPIAEHATR